MFLAIPGEAPGIMIIARNQLRPYRASGPARSYAGLRPALTNRGPSGPLSKTIKNVGASRAAPDAGVGEMPAPKKKFKLWICSFLHLNGLLS